jgi:hypothetical protein
LTRGGEPAPAGRRALLRAVPWAIPLGLALLASALAFRATHALGFAGHDSYPIVLTSRVSSFGDLLANFTEKLMHGRYLGAFYRPVLGLSVALDHAVWGLDPAGYQLTGAILFGGGGLVMFLLARRLLGGGALLGPLLAMSAFLLHPASVEVLPVLARRPELLCWLFMGLALWLEARPASLAAGKVRVLPALAGLLAMASKETALVLPGLAFLVVLLFSDRPALASRARQAGTAAVPHAIALAFFVAVRFAVLGGIGGHGVSGLGGIAGRAPISLLAVWGLLVDPEPVAGPGIVLLTRAWIWTGLLAIGSFLAARVWLAGRPLRVALLSIAMLLAVTSAYAFAGGLQPWYLFLPVAAFSLLIGALWDLAVLSLPSARGLRRGGVIALLGLVPALVAWQARYSPLVHHYEAWDEAARAGDACLGELARRVESAPAGTAIRCPPIPFWVPVVRGEPGVRGAAILADYSVAAWLELRFPSRTIRVTRSETDRPAPDELLVIADRLLPGYESDAPVEH